MVTISLNYFLDKISLYIILLILLVLVDHFLNLRNDQPIIYLNLNTEKNENKNIKNVSSSDSEDINIDEKNSKDNKTEEANPTDANNTKKKTEKSKTYRSKITGRVFKRTEFDEDDIVLTPEQQAEFWAEYYYTKPKKSEKKEEEKEKDPINEKNEKLFKLFWWFLLLNLLTLLACMVYEVVDMGGLINYAMTTKLHSHKDIYAETINKILSLTLEEMNVTHSGETFIRIIQSQIVDGTLTEDNLIKTIKLFNVQDEHLNSKYKILYCMLEAFINHYQGLSTQDTGKIRLIVKLCYTYCMTVELPYNKFDLIRIIRFIYNNHYK